MVMMTIVGKSGSHVPIRSKVLFLQSLYHEQSTTLIFANHKIKQEHYKLPTNLGLPRIYCLRKLLASYMNYVHFLVSFSVYC